MLRLIILLTLGLLFLLPSVSDAQKKKTKAKQSTVKKKSTASRSKSTASKKKQKASKSKARSSRRKGRASRPARQPRIVDETPYYDPYTAQPEIEVPPPQVFTMVEQMPEFNGELDQYLRDNIRYPDSARQNGIAGKVTLKFIVTMLGDIRDVTVVRPVHPLLDNEAMRVIKEMPRWKPGKQNGQFVNVFYTIPITFALQ
jgi:TonB family protein